jgi:hypothetical protein
VVLVDLDVIDKLRIVILPSVSARAYYSGVVSNSLLTSLRSRTALQIEILSLRHQLDMLQRSVKRPKLKRLIDSSGLALDRRLPPEVRELIRTMSRANPIWGAPRIHGELLKLGSDIAKPASANT